MKFGRTRQESSMIHSASPQTRLSVIAAWFRSFGTDRQKDIRTDNLWENSDHYRPGLWSASWIKRGVGWKKKDLCSWKFVFHVFVGCGIFFIFCCFHIFFLLFASPLRKLYKFKIYNNIFVGFKWKPIQCQDHRKIGIVKNSKKPTILDNNQAKQLKTSAKSQTFKTFSLAWMDIWMNKPTSYFKTF